MAFLEALAAGLLLAAGASLAAGAGAASEDPEGAAAGALSCLAAAL